MPTEPVQLDVYSFQIGEHTVELDLNQYVPIDETSLTHEFARQPASYAYLATLAAQAEAAYIDAKRQKDACYAAMDGKVRAQLAKLDKKATDAGVKALVEASPEYVAAVEAETAYHTQHLVLRAIVEAMAQRAQMLISLGAHMRMEADMTNMQIKDVRSTLDALKASKAS